MIEAGAPWGEPAGAGTARPVEGSDAALARALLDSAPGDLLAFAPDPPTDFARALGITGTQGPPRGLAFPVDLLVADPGGPAVNAVVLGPPPGRLAGRHRGFGITVEVDGRTVVAGRAQCVVVANGEFVDGADAVPRGHPGDGRLEVQAYDVPRPQRRELRRRILTGGHLPHPGIVQRRGQRVVVTTDRPVGCSLDGAVAGRTDRLEVDIRRPAGRVVV